MMLIMIMIMIIVDSTRGSETKKIRGSSQRNLGGSSALINKTDQEADPVIAADMITPIPAPAIFASIILWNCTLVDFFFSSPFWNHTQFAMNYFTKNQ